MKKFKCGIKKNKKSKLRHKQGLNEYLALQ